MKALIPTLVFARVSPLTFPASPAAALSSRFDETRGPRGRPNSWTDPFGSMRCLQRNGAGQRSG
jgi:hypothetical protein